MILIMAVLLPLYSANPADAHGFRKFNGCRYRSARLVQKRRSLAIACVIWLTVAGLALAASLPATATSTQSYLALGDSIAFGETNVIPVSLGDQGYVKPYANFLASQNGGVRPNVINLAYPGETSSSFFTAISPAGSAPHTILDSFNLNYQANPHQSQNSLMLSTIAEEVSAGHTITHVSFSLGRNDLVVFEGQHSDFVTLSRTQQQQLIATFFAGLAANYVTALGEIRAALPGTQILLLNSYTEAAIFGPTDLVKIVNEIFDAGQTR